MDQSVMQSMIKSCTALTIVLADHVSIDDQGHVQSLTRCTHPASFETARRLVRGARQLQLQDEQHEHYVWLTDSSDRDHVIGLIKQRGALTDEYRSTSLDDQSEIKPWDEPWIRGAIACDSIASLLPRFETITSVTCHDAKIANAYMALVPNLRELVLYRAEFQQRDLHFRFSNLPFQTIPNLERVAFASPISWPSFVGVVKSLPPSVRHLEVQIDSWYDWQLLNELRNVPGAQQLHSLTLQSQTRMDHGMHNAINLLVGTTEGVLCQTLTCLTIHSRALETTWQHNLQHNVTRTLKCLEGNQILRHLALPFMDDQLITSNTHMPVFDAWCNSIRQCPSLEHIGLLTNNVHPNSTDRSSLWQRVLQQHHVGRLSASLVLPHSFSFIFFDTQIRNIQQDQTWQQVTLVVASMRSAAHHAYVLSLRDLFPMIQSMAGMKTFDMGLWNPADRRDADTAPNAMSVALLRAKQTLQSTASAVSKQPDPKYRIDRSFDTRFVLAQCHLHKRRLHSPP